MADRPDKDLAHILKQQRFREFNLRQTDARANRPTVGHRSRSQSPPPQGSDLSVLTPTFVPVSTPTPIQTHTNTTNTRPIMSSEIKIETKFTGNVPESKDSVRYTSYTVHRWLNDTENRISSKGITNDLDKIREARLGVHTEIGDAAAVVNSIEMLAVKSWDEFKRKCLLLWRSHTEQDSFLALADLLNVPFYERQGDTISHLSKACDNVKQDLILKGKMKVMKQADWTDRPNEELVSLSEIFLHLSVGVIFNTLPPELKHIFRKVKFNYNDGLVEIMSKFSEEKAKSNRPVTQSHLSCVANSVKKNTPQQKNTNTQQNSHKSTNVICFKCKQIGHYAKDCRSKRSALVCSFCYRQGHLEKDCHQRAQLQLRKQRYLSKACNLVVDSEDDANAL